MRHFQCPACPPPTGDGLCWTSPAGPGRRRPGKPSAAPFVGQPPLCLAEEAGAAHPIAGQPGHPGGSVVEDVRRIRTHPLVPRRILIYGYVYDVRSGRLLEVPDATTEGRAG
jgi:hypothetical protein